MELGITIPLQKQLKLPAPSYGTENELFYCWELHAISLQGFQTLTAVNASNCFTVALCYLGADDWRHFPEIIRSGIGEALLAEGYAKEEIDLYFQKAGTSIVTKTHGRRPVAGLNRMMDFLWAAPVELDQNRSVQRALCRFANTNLCRAAGFEERDCPAAFLERDMRRCGIIK